MLNTPFAKTFMLLAVAAVIVAAFIYRAIEPRYGVPDEKLRVTHPAGFSMVQPREWTRNTPELFNGDFSKPYVLSFFESRSEVLPAEIVVTRLVQRPDDLPTDPPEAIAGRSMYRKINKRSKYLDTWLWFEEGGVWYRVVLSVPHSASPDDLLPYLATFRPEPPAVAPTTRPATPMPDPTTVTP